MNYMDFIVRLKSIAIDYRVRLIMDVPEAGSGYFFYFKDYKSPRRSDYICWDELHMTALELFAVLEKRAIEFRRELDGGVEMDGGV